MGVTMPNQPSLLVVLKHIIVSYWVIRRSMFFPFGSGRCREFWTHPSLPGLSPNRLSSIFTALTSIGMNLSLWRFLKWKGNSGYFGSPFMVWPCLTPYEFWVILRSNHVKSFFLLARHAETDWNDCILSLWSIPTSMTTPDYAQHRRAVAALRGPWRPGSPGSAPASDAIRMVAGAPASDRCRRPKKHVGKILYPGKNHGKNWVRYTCTSPK